MQPIASSTLESWLLSYAVNALWQIPIVFAAAWIAARASRRAGPAFQHALWVTALFAEVLLPACSASPAAALQTVLRWLHSLRHTALPQVAHVTVTMGSTHVAAGLQIPPTLLAATAIVYLCALTCFIARLGIGLHRTASLRRRAEPLALTGYARQSYHRFSQLFGVNDAVVAASSEIAGPITLGIRRPTLLLPLHLDLTLLNEDLDAALAHEFAHMHRRDFAKNLVYEILSLPIAFHPLLWLTRRHMAETREFICDAMAADVVAGRQRYARSLLRLAIQFSESPHPPTPHAIGIFAAHPFKNFERRVMNLTHKSTQLKGAARLATTSLSLALIAGACTSALAFRMNVAPPQAATPPAQAAVSSALPNVALALPQPGDSPRSYKLDVRSGTTSALPPGSYTLKVDAPNAQATQPQKAISVGAGVIAGERLTFVEPVYPPDAKAAKLSGTVIMHAVIGKDGTIQQLNVIAGPDEFRASALSAVRRWTYRPYLLNGKPVEVDTNITVNYSIPPATPASPQPANPSAPNPPASNLRQNPVVIHTGDPIYPAAAQANKSSFNGTVRVALVVGKDGLPKNLAISKGLSPDFDQSALAAVSQYRFQPALREGQPVETPLYIDVNFQLVR